MKRSWKYILITLAGLLAIVLAALLGLWRMGDSFWEAGLLGPYEGAPFPEALTTQPVSVLPVRDAGVLEVHEQHDQIAPVLLLRAADGKVRWTRLLRPERHNDDGSVTYFFLRDLRLRSIRPDTKGHRIRLTCEWEWGGREGGLIYLNPDFTFRGFGLSW